MTTTIPLIQRIAAWGVHLLTAISGVFGLFTLNAIYHHEFITAFWFMWAAVFIDAIDGSLARAVNVKLAAPKIDGALLDNLLDYVNYVITPAFFLIISEMLPAKFSLIITSIIVLASAYQFTQRDAKTDDHFFKGFPSYWNIVVFYLYIFQSSQITNAIVLLSLAVLVFVPMKYVYPSRLDYLTRKKSLRILTHLASVGYGIATIGILWNYPEIHTSSVIYSGLYIAWYLSVSLYRTYVPLKDLIQPNVMGLKQRFKNNHV